MGIKKRNQALKYVANKAMDYVVNKAASYMKGKVDAKAKAARTTSKAARSTKTQRSRAMNNPQHGATNSKSKGFLRTSRRVKNRLDVYAIKGAIKTVERGGVIDTYSLTQKQQVAYVGHTTFAPDHFKDMICRALIKRLFWKAGITIGDFNSVCISANTTATYRITVHYSAGIGTTNADSKYTIDQPVTNTFDQSVIALNTWLFSAWTNDQVVFKALTLTTLHNTTVSNVLSMINLERTKIHVNVKSSLKIQNRSTNSSNTSEDVVDNVPLYGRSYEGPGNGCVGRSFSNVQNITAPGNFFPASLQAFEIAPGTNNNYQDPSIYGEPPLPRSFHNCKRSGKIHLDPGEIKTSVISYVRSFGFNTIFNVLFNGTTTPAGTLQRFFYGNYRMFCVEKMITAIAQTDASSIKVAYEVDTKMGLYVTDTNFNMSSYVVDLSPV